MLEAEGVIPWSFVTSLLKRKTDVSSLLCFICSSWVLPPRQSAPYLPPASRLAEPFQASCLPSLSTA